VIGAKNAINYYNNRHFVQDRNKKINIKWAKCIDRLRRCTNASRYGVAMKAYNNIMCIL